MTNGQEITTHEGIVEGFRKEAIKRGRQTENTPFMKHPLGGIFGSKLKINKQKQSSTVLLFPPRAQIRM